jgi:hypothetical protein
LFGKQLKIGLRHVGFIGTMPDESLE